MRSQPFNPLRVLFVTPALKHYRVPILRLVGQSGPIALTVAHSGLRVTRGESNFEEILISERRVGPFFCHGGSFLGLCNEYDVVVMMHYIQRLSFVRAAYWRRRNFRLVYWGIGVRASQKNDYGARGISDVARYEMAKRADAMLFYSSIPIERYVRQGIDRSKLFVANNTVQVISSDCLTTSKDSILFVGTLNRSKKIHVLLEEYLEAYRRNRDVPPLNIVGGGPDLDLCTDWVAARKMRDKVFVRGPIYDDLELEGYFKRALVCISPGQAGLSVLTSMGYGVPFVTSRQAKTGGELFNIAHNETGVLLEQEQELRSLIGDIADNPKKYIQMGDNAQSYYREQRSPEQMAQGIIDAVQHAALA